MSIAEFSELLKNQAYKKWLNNPSVNIIKDKVSQLRLTEQRSNRNSLLVTKNTIYDVVNKLTGREPTQQELDSVYSNLRNSRKPSTGRREAIQLKEDNSLYFPKVNFDRISRILEHGFKDIVTDKKISDFFHRGHVYGLPTNIGMRTLENLASSGIPDNLKEKLLLMLGELISELDRQDLATSNIKDSEYRLYAKYAKTRNKYLIELQIGSENQSAGLDTAPITNAIRRYFDPKNVVAISRLLKERPEDAFIKQLIEAHGSPSVKDLAIASIVNTLTGKPQDKKIYTVPNTLIVSTKVKFSNAEFKAENAKQKAELIKLRNKVKSIRTVGAMSPSTASLEALLRSRLALQIRENMGTGASKNVLNYRTGRFAESATIERLMASSAGMITVFYDYMKYPYATFSAGGAQEYPKSRDPKLLISKSIREIGAALVSNRLRAVVV